MLCSSAADSLSGTPARTCSRQDAGGGFKASFCLQVASLTPVSQTAAYCSARYCLAPAVTPFSPGRPALPPLMPGS